MDGRRRSELLREPARSIGEEGRDPAEHEEAPPGGESASPVLEWVLKSSIDGLFAFGRDLRFTLWSDSMERLSGVPAREAIGRSARELVPSLVDGDGSPFLTTLEGKSVFTTNATFRRGEAAREVYAEGYFSP